MWTTVVNDRNKGVEGFTLVEVMIAMAVGGIVMAAVMTVFLSQHRTYLAQDDVVEMQQNARVAMDMLVRDIRSAGYDPTGAGLGFITTTDSQTLTFERYDDANNVVETIRYTLYDAYAGTVSAVGRAVAATDGSFTNQPVATNITRLEFRYLDADGVPTAVQGNIRSVQVSILVQTSRADPNGPSGQTYTTPSGIDWTSTAGFRSRYLTTTVQCRNLGL